MESKKERVLAYSKAKLIGMDDLSNVSGGSHSTGRSTFKPSAAGDRSLDASLDITLDN